MSYAYGNTGWKDLLTSYNGQSITYDTIGNPLSYRGMTLTWQNGRQLATLTKSGATSSYSYDINGNRTKKVAGGATTEYYLNEGTIVAEKKGSELIRYLFDENGSRYGLEWKGTKYYYVFNGQGDVIGITDPRNRLAVSYTYDAWGKLLSTGGDNPALAAANPIRYRGYYYDIESGLYYLGSRYYDPETGRFINADGLLGANGDILSYNLFAYCSNNPVNFSDPSGYGFWSWLTGLFGGKKSNEATSSSASSPSGSQGACKSVGSGVSTSAGKVPPPEKEKKPNIFEAAAKSVKIDAGFGTGVKANADVGAVNAGIGAQYDVVHLKVEKGEMMIGYYEEGPGLQGGIGPAGYDMGAAFHPANCECHYAGVNPDCPNTIWYEPGFSCESGFGFDVYMLIGCNASINFDFNYFFEQVFG